MNAQNIIKSFTSSVDKSEIEKKYAMLKMNLCTYTQEDWDKAHNANQQIESARAEHGEKGYVKSSMDLHHLTRPISEQEECDRLLETLRADLMHCPCRYVITDDPRGLLSPAGFDIDSRVFVQTKVAIHTDSDPAKLNLKKRYNCPLYVTDLSKVCK